MLGLLYFFIFIFGTIIGSFINVVAFRYNSGVSIMGRSFCPSCNKQLSWYELFPILSFLIQKGKCLTCKSKISWRYFWVEILTGLVFLGVGYKLGLSNNMLNIENINSSLLLTFLYYCFVFAILIAITLYDLEHKIIPDGLVFVFILSAFLKMFFDFNTGEIIYPSYVDLLSGPILAVPFAFLWLVSGGRWMGLGDAKLSLGIGWMLGIVYGLSAIVLSFWIGAVVSVVLIILSKIEKIKTRLTIKSEIPFAPFMVLATFFIFIFEWDLLNINALF